MNVTDSNFRGFEIPSVLQVGLFPGRIMVVAASENAATRETSLQREPCSQTNAPNLPCSGPASKPDPAKTAPFHVQRES